MHILTTRQLQTIRSSCATFFLPDVRVYRSEPNSMHKRPNLGLHHLMRQRDTMCEFSGQLDDTFERVSLLRPAKY